jgi:hypothetical protein
MAQVAEPFLAGRVRVEPRTRRKHDTRAATESHLR